MVLRPLLVRPRRLVVPFALPAISFSVFVVPVVAGSVAIARTLAVAVFVVSPSRGARAVPTLIPSTIALSISFAPAAVARTVGFLPALPEIVARGAITSTKGFICVVLGHCILWWAKYGLLRPRTAQNDDSHLDGP